MFVLSDFFAGVVLGLSIQSTISKDINYQSNRYVNVLVVSSLFIVCPY